MTLTLFQSGTESNASKWGQGPNSSYDPRPNEELEDIVGQLTQRIPRLLCGPPAEFFDRNSSLNKISVNIDLDIVAIADT